MHQNSNVLGMPVLCLRLRKPQPESRSRRCQAKRCSMRRSTHEAFRLLVGRWVGGTRVGWRCEARLEQVGQGLALLLTFLPTGLGTESEIVSQLLTSRSVAIVMFPPIERLRTFRVLNTFIKSKV